jgi:gas vesicle protein
LVDSTSGSLWVRDAKSESAEESRDAEHHPAGPLKEIDTKALHHYILVSERWRGFMYAVGYELHQLKKMQTICEDATIKVRRLVHNFKEKMEQVEEQVWDDNHELRDDFSFEGISTAGIREIILLHDWHAANAGNKTFGDMGFENDEQFMQFRRKCNKIAYNLRKNQYAQMISMQKVRIQDMIHTLTDKIQDRDQLKFHDKYGKEGQ